jgi:hypothetical protein
MTGPPPWHEGKRQDDGERRTELKRGAETMTEQVTDLTKGYYRRIYSGFLEGRKISSVSVEAEAWFWRIHAVADDFGNLTADPTLLHRATAGLRDVRASQVVRWVSELVKVGLVGEYRCGPEKYLHVIGWTDRQPTANGRRVRRCPPPTSEDIGSWIHPDSPGSPCTDSDIGSGSGSGERKRAKEKLDGFERFWAARPRNHRWTAKAKALDKWSALGLEARADDVIRSLEAWKVSHEWTKDGGQFICGAEPWLNQEKYEICPMPAVDDAEAQARRVLARMEAKGSAA